MNIRYRLLEDFSRRCVAEFLRVYTGVSTRSRGLSGISVFGAILAGFGIGLIVLLFVFSGTISILARLAVALYWAVSRISRCFSLKALSEFTQQVLRALAAESLNRWSGQEPTQIAEDCEELLRYVRDYTQANRAAGRQEWQVNLRSLIFMLSGMRGILVAFAILLITSELSG